MPQLSMWAARHPIGWSAAVALNPLEPTRPSALTIQSFDQARHPMESATMQVPANVLHEAVSGLLHDCWDAWLFGDPGAMKAAFTRLGTEWRKEARQRPLW